LANQKKLLYQSGSYIRTTHISVHTM